MSGTDTHTLATELRDFPEWHGGIRHYAVWALPVDCPLWLQRIADLQRQLAPLLHSDYARQPHITLFACGLVDQRHFHPQQARPKSMTLGWGVSSSSRVIMMFPGLRSRCMMPR